MKAVVRYKMDGVYRTKTIKVEKNEPCHIVREFIKQAKVPKYTYITSVKCGRYVYEWLDTAYSAY